MKPLAVYIGTINCSSSFLFYLLFLEGRARGWDEHLLSLECTFFMSTQSNDLFLPRRQSDNVYVR